MSAIDRSDKGNKMELDHPCRQTCSGWQQGFDRGVESYEAFRKENDEIIMKLQEQLGLAVEAFEKFRALDLVPYSPDSDEGIAVDIIYKALAKIDAIQNPLCPIDHNPLDNK